MDWTYHTIAAYAARCAHRRTGGRIDFDDLYQEAALGTRLWDRFGVRRAEELAARDAHALIEELLRRIAERDGVEIEEVRRQFSPQRAQRHGETRKALPGILGAP